MRLSYFEKRVALEFLENDIVLAHQGIISLVSHRIIFGLISTKLTCSCNSCLTKFIQAKRYCDSLFDLLTLKLENHNLREDTETLVYEIYSVIQSAHECTEASNTVANKETQTIQAEIQNFSPVSPPENDRFIIQDMSLTNTSEPFQIPDF